MIILRSDTQINKTKIKLLHKIYNTKSKPIKGTHRLKTYRC